jgi:hypothetical protein
MGRSLPFASFSSETTKHVLIILGKWDAQQKLCEKFYFGWHMSDETPTLLLLYPFPEKKMTCLEKLPTLQEM